MKEDFERSLANVLVSEGGYSNDPHDPGGATMNGIIQTEYDRWRTAHNLPHRSVRYLAQDERDQIYRLEYWDAVGGDDLPAGLDYCVFDFGVNSGVSRALRYLHSLEPGISGDDAINAYCDARLEFLQGLHTWRYFGKGWGARVAKVRRIALEMMMTANGVREAQMTAAAQTSQESASIPTPENLSTTPQPTPTASS